MPGTIDDYNAVAKIGVITLSDGAVIGFGAEACEEFTPLIGLRVVVRGTAVPPDVTVGEETEAPGLWASRIRLFPGSESEYAARLRIYQVERALRMSGDREGEIVAGSPPWARGKNRPGRKPSGPQRPADGFFVMTIVLQSELPNSPGALSLLIDPIAPIAPIATDPAAAADAGKRCGVWRKPSVRIIPLVRNSQTEPGFSAEIQSGPYRAFMLYRPQPYGEAGSGGRAHVGLFVGGPHSPRVAATLTGRNAQTPVAVQPDSARVLADLARAILLGQPDAVGLVLNRAGKAFKPRDIALSQLGDGGQLHVPFVAWIDWNRGLRGDRSCLVSSGMEMLALPDVAVALAAEETAEGASPQPAASAMAGSDVAEARARDVLLYVCDQLIAGAIGRDVTEISVPRHIRLLPGSQLEVGAAEGHDIYRVAAYDGEWIELIPVAETEK